LQSQYQLTYIFISHAMSVVRYVSNRICVMYGGKMVEVGEKTELLAHPKHPYSEVLLGAVPRPSQRRQIRKQATKGEPPDPANLPPGCVFHPRCHYAEEVCKVEPPALRKLESGSFVSCHLAEKLALEGIHSG
jgi:peptide/nickel transport system ATP-binding protein